jgi:hypothetical protein
MAADSIHTKYVREWMKHASPASPDQLAELFEHAMSALWHRTHSALGDITVAAIVDRVLYNATEKYPILGSLKLGAKGVDFAQFRENAGSFHDGELREAIQFVLGELLTVVGNLTAEILTAALHSGLSSVSLKDPRSKQSGEKDYEDH